MKTILYPQTFDQKPQKQNQKSKSKDKRHVTNAKEQYETIENIISVQKILQEEKKNIVKQIEIKTDLVNK
ncbi:unnamed protein product [Adineta steineri]|uniref:Uncharacterized protein n=1 Tax=Adineta steineri TaxID=433720 RepID=A0A814VGW7_9BILA|nr:unnamed protein product [Adineta steineri]CAF3696894.1 unnamed protein product [Adineta steineri]